MSVEVDVDQIVREVLARLRGSDAAKNTSAGSSGPGESSGRATRVETTADRLELKERLVTLATLENRLDGIRHIVLPRGAVVTPAARDLLRERNIGTSYAAGAAAGKATPAPLTMVVGCADLARSNQPFEGTPFDRAAFVESLSREGIVVEQIAATGLASVVAELADHAARGGRAALLLTRQPEAGAVIANRTAGVRAVAARDGGNLRQAVLATGANFLALDPASAASAARVVREFCAGWPHPVPAVLNTNR